MPISPINTRPLQTSTIENPTTPSTQPPSPPVSEEVQCEHAPEASPRNTQFLQALSRFREALSPSDKQALLRSLQQPTTQETLRRDPARVDNQRETSSQEPHRTNAQPSAVPLQQLLPNTPPLRTITPTLPSLQNATQHTEEL